MATESVIFTALPNGFHPDGKHLGLTVFVSPRLSTDGAGELPLVGSGFDAFEDWPNALSEVAFSLNVDGVGTRATAPDPRSEQPTSDTWNLLFAGTRVQDGVFTDLSTRRFLSFPVRNASAYLFDLYTEIAEGYPAEFPPITTGALFHLAEQLGLLSRYKEEFYPGLDGLIAQESGPAGKSGRYLDRALLSPYEHELMTFAEAYRFYDRPGSRDPEGPDDTPDEPKPPDIDFHGAVASCGDYPELLRRLGLATDLIVSLDPALPPVGRVRVEIESPRAWMNTEEARPWTSYLLDERRFIAQPRDMEGDLVDGTLRLEDSDAFLVTQVDVDGAAMKVTDFAANLSRLTEDLSSGAPSMIDELSSLPALRTGGFTVARDQRAGRLVAHLDDSADHEAAHSARGAPELFAEDVTRGYRLDVEDSIKPGRWLSLHRRRGVYTVEGNEETVTLPIDPDEGFVKGESATAVPGDDQDLYLHEAVFGWDGWSLSARRPGQAITDTGAETIEPSNPTDVPLFTAFEATAGSLPRLRFGRTYRFRARAVDLAGNSVPEDDLVPQHVSDPHTFRRFDPVPSPAIVPRRSFTEGESLMRMVIRSTLGVTPDGYVALSRIAGLSGHTDELTKYIPQNERHLAAPISSQQLAEWHGRFDAAVGEDTSQADLDTQFDVAARESGSFLQDGPGVFVVNPDPNATPTDLSDPSREKGDPLAQGEYVCHDVESLELPYLPDPMSLGVSFTTLPGDLATRLLPWEGGPDWYDRKPVRIRIEGIEDGTGAPSYDPAARLLTVFLPQAEMVTIRLSSFTKAADLDLMAIWMMERPAVRGTQQTIAEEGRHWMLTPGQPLTLVHAVEKPLSAPVINVPAPGVPGGGVLRDTGDTFAVLSGSISNHAKSTGRLDVEARWTEPIDDLARDGPSVQDGKAHIGDFLLAGDEDDCRVGEANVPGSATSPPIHKLRHEMGDTKHRWVKYRATATTRFREYFPTEITDDPKLVTSTGDERLLNVPASRRPEPPEILYVIPTWTWSETPIRRQVKGFTRSKSSKPGLRRTRSGGGLRVYMDRPWYSSGDDELLGVVLEDQPWITWPFDISVGLVASASEIAWADEIAGKILDTGLVEKVGPASRSPSDQLLTAVMNIRTADEAETPTDFDDLGREVSEGPKAGDAPQLSPDQRIALQEAIGRFWRPKGDLQQFITRWGMDPIWGSEAPNPGPFIHQLALRTAVGTGLPLSEAPGHKVTVVGHQPEFDADRKLWYCDLQFDAGSSYTPFVRLALVRYQPHAIEGQHLSKVVFPDFAQLVPERSATVTEVGTNRLSVTLRGPGGYSDLARQLASPFGGLDTRLSLSRKATAQIERLRANAKTDLAWEPVGDEVQLELSSPGGLSDIRYSGIVDLPRRGKTTELRLSVREFEILPSDDDVAEGHVTSEWLSGFGISRPVRHRLVYADHIPL